MLVTDSCFCHPREAARPGSELWLPAQDYTEMQLNWRDWIQPHYATQTPVQRGGHGKLIRK